MAQIAAAHRRDDPATATIHAVAHGHAQIREPR